MMENKMDAEYLKKNNINFVKHFENKLNFEFSEHVSFIKGEVTSNGQMYQMDCCCALLVKVNKVSEEKFLELLGSNCSRRRKPLPSPSRICKIGDEFEKMDLIEKFLVYRTGKYVKTEYIFIYVACDGNDIYVLFEG